MKKFSYPESLKLKSKKSISALFEQGCSISKPPIRLLWQQTAKDEEKSLKAGFTVSKKSFKKAVDRNLLKRRMREAFRLNRHLMSDLQGSGLKFDLMFIFTSGEKSEYKEIENSMIFLLNALYQKCKPG